MDGPKPAQGAKDKRGVTKANINLIDLAGSERCDKSHAKGKTLQEGKAINQGLSSLGRVISQLGQAIAKAEREGKDIPTGRDLGGLGWRTSKLTFLLRDQIHHT